MGPASFSIALSVSQRVRLAIFLLYVVLCASFNFLTAIRKHDDIESWNFPFDTRGQQFSRHSSNSPKKRRFSDGLFFVLLHSLFLIYISLKPMFRREAVWIQFDQLGTGPAVKISVGGRFMLFAGN